MGGVIGVIAAGSCDVASVGVCAAGNPAIVGGGIALGAAAGIALEKSLKRAKASLDTLISKISNDGPEETQYALVANTTGEYPDVRNETVTLQAGDVWKYGTTGNPEGRYSNAYLSALGVVQVTQYTGTHSQTLVVEKLKLINYAVKNLSLPPGNRIFK